MSRQGQTVNALIADNTTILKALVKPGNHRIDLKYLVKAGSEELQEGGYASVETLPHVDVAAYNDTPLGEREEPGRASHRCTFVAALLKLTKLHGEGN